MVNPWFKRSFRVVTVVHFAALLAMVLVSACQSLIRPRAEVHMPVEFVVEAPAGEAGEEQEPEIEPIAIPKPKPKPDPAVKPKPEPVVKPVPAPKPKPAPPKPRVAKIETSKRLVTRPGSSKQPPKLTDREIMEWLMKGAKLGDRTSIPDEESRGFEAVRNALYRAWNQPSQAEAGHAVAEVSLRLAMDGSVISADLSQRSGNPTLDVSVQRAMASVRRIDGVTAEFVKRHPVIEIAFKVE
jgi:outer membrane biosynthesis protein TonB